MKTDDHIRTYPFSLELAGIKRGWRDLDVVILDDVLPLEDVGHMVKQRGMPAYLVHNAYSAIQPRPWLDHTKLLCLPFWLALQQRDFQGIPLPRPSELETTHCFNFLANRSNLNRFLLMKLIQWFRLDSFQYTWSGAPVPTYPQTVQELDNLGLGRKDALSLRKHLLRPLDGWHPQWIGQRQWPRVYHRVEYGSNWDSWCDLRDMMSSTAVSLITETPDWQTATVFSEKSLMSAMALTIPIWIGGGSHQAEHWSRLGFDTFDDVVNHDYQYCATVTERCYRAIQLNLDLLRDVKHSTALRKKLLPRLKHNQKISQSDSIMRHCRSLCQCLPREMQIWVSQVFVPWTYYENRHNFRDHDRPDRKFQFPRPRADDHDFWNLVSQDTPIQAQQ